jgi:hypothetical protein
VLGARISVVAGTSPATTKQTILVAHVSHLI